MTLATIRKPMLLALLCLAAATLPLAAQASGSTQAPWYRDKLRALGFQVMPKPVPMPDFGVASLASGAPVKLSSLRGKIVLVNFWATWCPPCRSEMPSIDKLWNATKDKPFYIMGISEGEEKTTVSTFIAKNGYSYPIFLDGGSQIGSMFGVDGIPTTYVVDKAGNAIAGVVGGIEFASPEALAVFAELAAK